MNGFPGFSQLQSWPCAEMFLKSNPGGIVIDPPEVAAPLVYYKLDSISGAYQALDSAGTNHTNQGNGTRSLVAGKISNGWQGGGFTTANLGTGVFAQKFTVRFWWKYGANVGSPVQGSDAATVQGWTATVGVDGKFYIHTTDNALNDTNCKSTIVVTDGAWHRVLLGYDPDTNEAFLQVDQETRITATPLATSFGYGVFYMYFVDLAWSLDEVGYWSNYIWNNGDSVCDWNSGAGRTYPDVPGVLGGACGVSGSGGGSVSHPILGEGGEFIQGEGGENIMEEV